MNPASSAVDIELPSPGVRERIRRAWHRVLTSGIGFDIAYAERYTVRRAISSQDRDSVLALRRSGYGPQETFDAKFDDGPNARVWICHAPDGRPVGTMRFVVDLDGSRALGVDQVMKCPSEWAVRADGSPARRSEARKLCVAGRTRAEQLAAKLSLWRSFFWASQDLDIDWMLVLARAPINEDYRGLRFQPPKGDAPLWVTPPGDVPHEALALGVCDPLIPWRQPGHWLYPWTSRPLGDSVRPNL